MSKNKSPLKVVWLLLLVVCLLLPLQWLPSRTVCGCEIKPVGMLADVLPAKWLPKSAADSVPAAPKVKPAFVDSCPRGMECIEEYEDSAHRGMTPFYEALLQGKKLGRPVRIAYFGDSFIEGDIMTADLREMLQRKFGGCGVGYLDADPQFPQFRRSVGQSSKGWQMFNLIDKPDGFQNSLMGLRCQYALPEGTATSEVRCAKHPFVESSDVHSIYLKTTRPTTISVSLDGGAVQRFTTKGTGALEVFTANGHASRTRWTVSGTPGTVCWAVSEDGKSGITLDNLALRSSAGSNLASIPDKTLVDFGKARPYDLIVLQYGLNVANKKSLGYDTYTKAMSQVIEKFKKAFPTAGFLIVSVGDRGERTANGEIHTYPGVQNLIRYQQNLAADNRVAFWNLYNGMGGDGAIAKMVDAKQAQKDYTHINFDGGKRVAGIIYKTLIHGFDQYKRRKEYESK